MDVDLLVENGVVVIPKVGLIKGCIGIVGEKVVGRLRRRSVHGSIPPGVGLTTNELRPDRTQLLSHYPEPFHSRSP